MDQNITPESRNAIFDGTWRINFEKLLEIKDSLNGFCSFSIYLPYAAVHGTGGNVDFINIEKSYKSNKAKLSYNNIYLMNLEISEKFGKRIIGLTLTYPARVNPNQIIKKSNFHFYKWNRKFVSISKQIGTTNLKKIEGLSWDLLKESQKFFILYCEPVKTLNVRAYPYIHL